MAMGCWRSKPVEPARPLVQGPPLSTKDIYRLKNSWKAIQRQIDETGNVIFLRYFPSDSKLQKIFRKLSSSSDDDKILNNLKDHANVTMGILDRCIMHMDDAEYVTSILIATRLIHFKYQGFTHSYFWRLKEPFLEAVHLMLQDRYTESIQRIYIVAINYIIMNLAGGLLDDDVIWDYEQIREELKHGPYKLNANVSDTLGDLHLDISVTKRESCKLAQYGIPWRHNSVILERCCEKNGPTKN